MNVRFDLDNPIMRAILGIAEYFLDTAAIRLDHERSSFLHQSLVKLMLKIKEEILGRRASLGLQFCRSPLRVPSIYCDSKEI